MRARQSRFARNVAGTAAANVLTVVVSTATGLVVARLLGSSGRGTYAAVTAYVLSTAAVCECGLTASICYHVASRRDDAATVLRTGTVAILVCGTAAGIGGFFLAPHVLDDYPHGVAALRIAFAAEPVLFLGGAWLSALQAVDIRSWNRVRLSQPFFYVLLVVVVATLGHLDVIGVTAAFIGSSAMQCALAWWVRRGQLAVGGHCRSDVLRPMLRYGLANTTSRVPYLVNTKVDVLVLATLVSASELGSYSVAVTLSLAAAPLSTAIGSVVLPRVAAERDVLGRGLLTRAVGGSLGIGLVAAVIVCGTAPVVVPLVLGHSYHNVVSLLWVLAPGAVVYGTNRVIGDILRGFDRSVSVAVAEGVALVVTVVLLVVLLPREGVLGAAVASSVAYATAFVFLLQALLRHTGTTASQAVSRLRDARLSVPGQPHRADRPEPAATP